jgi:hypothetical protein
MRLNSKLGKRALTEFWEYLKEKEKCNDWDYWVKRQVYNYLKKWLKKYFELKIPKKRGTAKET